MTTRRDSISLLPILAAAAAAMAVAAAPAAGAGELHNVSLRSLGAKAAGSGAPFNKDWPPANALAEGIGGGGTLFGRPMVGARVDITLLIPVDIAALEVVPLDYHGTQQPKAIDIFVDDKLAKQAELPETPGKPIRVPLAARGRRVGILVTAVHPRRTLADGRQGPDYGGWARLRVLSPTNLAHMLRPVDGHDVRRREMDIAPTAGSIVAGEVKVHGMPREAKGHPWTIWDGEDIARYRALLPTSPELRAHLEGLRQAMDKRITQPVGVPEARQDADGNWLHLSDMEKTGDGRTLGAVHNQLSLDIANLGTLYALTGEERYAEFAKRILLAYADEYPNYGIGARPGFNHSPSKAFDQVLGDAIWIIQAARGYDLIHNLPSLTAGERRRIEEDFLGSAGRLIMANRSLLQSPTNWSAIGTAALLIIGYATDNEEFVRTAMHGLRGTPEKPTGGLFECHFGPRAIDADGMWSEGAMGYQFMALQALICDAEILWHHGIDLYSHRDGVLKSLFDSPLRFAYPDLTTPAIHDSGHGSLIGYDSYLYEFAYRRYRDPAYLHVLSRTGRRLAASFQQFPVSILYDLDPQAEASPIEWKSVNFFGVGYGILRLTAGAGTTSLLLDYGPNRSHGHPDKLNIDLYAFNDRLIPDPGSIWYEQPLYRKWYRTTLAHNTLVVDEADQDMADAVQLVYGPAATIAIQRAMTQTACPGLTLDRSLFLATGYLADIFGVFTRIPRQMDLAWHIRGTLETDLPLRPAPFPEPVADGYSELANVRAAKTARAWKASVAREGNVARFHAAGGVPTEIIVGDGLLGRERPPTILLRRHAATTLYGCVVDISAAGDGHVRAVRLSGGLDDGYGLLEVTTVRGRDSCFTAFRSGTFRAGGVTTDARQAFVLRDGRAVRAMFLGGGTRLESAGAVLRRRTPGLACFELIENGACILANPSPSNSVLAIRHPALKGRMAYVLDHDGRRLGEAAVAVAADGTAEIELPAAGQMEFAVPGAPDVHEHRRALLEKRQAEQRAADAAARAACAARTAEREAEAAAHPLPPGTVIVVGAARHVAEDGGSVKISATKVGAVGESILGWDAPGHWLEWEVTAPAAGYYHLTLCYCTQGAAAERTIHVNGVEQEPCAPLILEPTGGFSNTSDDWRLRTAMDPASGKPLLVKLEKGPNTIRLTNANGCSANVNYLAFTSPDVEVSRELLAKRLSAGDE